jgi:cytochrome b561
MRHSFVTQPAETQGLRHDPVTIGLHWITAFLAGGLWTIGQTIDVFPNGPLRIDYRSVHIVFGVVLALVVLARLAWRLTRQQMLTPLDTGLLLIVARATHWALYALLVITLGLGVTYSLAQGEVIFNVLHIAPMTGDRALSRRLHGWHALAANATLIVAGVHAAAALFHHYVMRDATLRRMLPWEFR